MQIVGYETGDAALLVSDGDADVGDGDVAVGDGDVAIGDEGTDVDGNDRDLTPVERVPLTPGAELAYTLGERRCAGTITAAGHVACEASAGPFCSAHDRTWVCARCTGTCLKDEMDCHEDHAIYLAAFAPNAFKVGVTKRHRLERRLREQGADRGAHLRTVENGRIARQIEAELAADGPGDFVRVETKRAGLGRDLDERAWESLLSQFDPVTTYDFDYGLDLDERPVGETVATGVVRATKGRLLVLDRGDTKYAVDLRDLVGHEVEPRRTERSLQSSLGAFE